MEHIYYYIGNSRYGKARWEEIAIKGNDDQKKNRVIAQQKASISVPFTVAPKVNTKEAISHCCGDPVVKQKYVQCEYCHKNYMSFVLSQNICVEIPIEFSAEAIAKNACIDYINNDRGE